MHRKRIVMSGVVGLLAFGGVGVLSGHLFAQVSPPTGPTLTVIPRGVIVSWYGPINQIPGGWLLCDGTQGTPDLRDRFIVGAGAAFPVHQDDPSPEHDHGVSGVAVPQHVHQLSTRVAAPVRWNNDHHLGVTTDHDNSRPWGDQYEKNRYGVAEEFLTTTESGAAAAEGRTDGAAALPPYHALAFIMKK
jgi:hypothetical protein